MRRIKCVDTLYTVLVGVHIEIIEGVLLSGRIGRQWKCSVPVPD